MRIRCPLAILFALVAAILVARVALAALINESGPLLVVGLNHVHAGSLPPGVTISGWDDHVATIDGNGHPMVRWLYAHGAILVLPGKPGGCLSLSTTTAN